MSDNWLSSVESPRAAEAADQQAGEKGARERMPNPDDVLSLARYNAWQNREMTAALEALPDAALRVDRGAFFGSILATINHLLWADMVWMSRFAHWPAPGGGLEASTELAPTLAAWVPRGSGRTRGSCFGPRGCARSTCGACCAGIRAPRGATR